MGAAPRRSARLGTSLVALRREGGQRAIEEPFPQHHGWCAVRREICIFRSRLQLPAAPTFRRIRTRTAQKTTAVPYCAEKALGRAGAVFQKIQEIFRYRGPDPAHRDRVARL